VASKSGQDPSATTEDIDELLDGLDKTLDRLKTLYEQYFLGIQKQAPAYIHSDVERKLRDLMQMQIRNTGLRYRLNSIQAKFAAYNSYWRRTLRQIENGTYIRNLSKIGRQAARSGADIPEEILAAMPKRMREQVLKDREVALAAARRNNQVEDEPLSLADEPALVKESTDLRRQVRGAHVVTKDDDFDIDAFFKEVEGNSTDDKTEDTPAVAPPAPAPVRPPVFAAPQRPSSPAVQPSQPGILRPPPGPVPPIPRPPTSPGLPAVPPPRIPTPPSQAARPNPVAPGSAAARGDVPVESMPGPFPRQPTGPVPRPVPTASASGPIPRPTGPTTSGPIPVMTETGPVPRQPTGPVPRPPGAPRPAPPVSAQSQPTRPTPAPAAQEPGMRPPPGMTDADVNALYAKYVKAKQAVGEQAGPGAYGKLLKTINQQAPKIMEQYKAKGVDFSVVVKDNQVIIRAKPKP
jgi:hypothetical protein